MKKDRTVNMTEGNPFRLLIAFAIPMLIGNLFQQAYNLADSMIVGKFIGADALAAVGSTGSISFLFFSLCNGIGSGGGIITAQFFGAGDGVRVRKAIVNSAWIMLTVSMLTGLVSFLAAPSVLRLMGTPESIRQDAITYMRMTCISVPLVGIYNYASSMLRALGDSKTPLSFLIVACLINVVLDLVFVRVFHLGVFGAALATTLSQLIAGCCCLIYAFRSNPYFHPNPEERRFDWIIAKQTARIGLPLAVQWSLIAVSTSALQTLVNSFGTAAMAAYTTTCRIDQLVQQPFGSLCTALSTYAGQNFGAGKARRLRDGIRANMLLSLAFSVLMLIVVQLFSAPIMKQFVNEEEVIRLGGTGLIITSWFYFFLSLIYTARGVLNGVGDVVFSFINGGVEIICRFLLPLGLLLIPNIGVWRIWWTSALTWVISAAFCVLRYYFWQKKNGLSVRKENN